ncbi:MAG TPA: hypothetical protein VD996_02870 [Chitinophagaceae bacterium]|nr:hypothetical protein [Chitinophagaceae bacterium]
MTTHLSKLLSISSPPLSPAVKAPAVNAKETVIKQLYSLLEKRNGFYAFENALHVFALTPSPGQFSLSQWNDPALWISNYGGLADGMLFFAEDILGMQFGIKENKIYTFEPEYAAVELIATDLEGWAKAILDDYNYLTGYPLAHDWQMEHGSLPPGKRLAPKIPLVGGGKLDVSNMYAADPVQLMRFRGMIAQKIKDLPDGTRIKFTVE